MRAFILFLMCVSGPAIGVRGCAFPDPAGLVPTGPDFKFGGGGEEVIGTIKGTLTRPDYLVNRADHRNEGPFGGKNCTRIEK